MMVSVHKTCEPYIRFCGTAAPTVLYTCDPYSTSQFTSGIAKMRAIAGGAAVRRVQYHE